MKKAGIIDPLKVTRHALQNAASVAGTILLTEAVVVDKPNDKKDNGYSFFINWINYIFSITNNGCYIGLVTRF